MNFEYFPEKYNSEWPGMFKIAAAKIKNAAVTLAVDHIGSTAISGMLAKPIIDILVTVEPGFLDKMVKPMSLLGYQFKGENGISGRAYFTKPKNSQSAAIHVHAFETGFREVKRHLAFRDYLLAHPEIAKNYLDLKLRILSRPNITRDEYQNLKQEFLAKTTTDAVEWQK